MSFNQYVTTVLAEAVGGQMAAQTRPTSHDWNKTFTQELWDPSFVNHNYEPVSTYWRWQIVNNTPPAGKVTTVQFIDTLTRLASQLPNKSVGKLKEKKDAKKEHSAFEIC